MISYQQFMESYHKTQNALNESREEYDPEADIPKEYSLSYQEEKSNDGLDIPSKYTTDSPEEIEHGINSLNNGIKRSLDSGRYSPVNHSIDDINYLVSQRNLTPFHKSRLLSAMVDHNNALQTTGSDIQPHEYATENQERRLCGSSFNPKTATLPKLEDLHSDYISDLKDRNMSETDRIFGSEAGFNRYKHG